MSTFTATFAEIKSWPVDTVDWHIDPDTGLRAYVEARVGEDYPITAGDRFSAFSNFRAGRNFHVDDDFCCGDNFRAGHEFEAGCDFSVGNNFEVGNNFCVGDNFRVNSNCLEAAYTKLVLAELGNAI